MILHRVFWEIRGAAPEDPGGARFIPAQGAGRFDNPGKYVMLYASREEKCAVVEALGRFPAWNAALFDPPTTLAASARRSLATYELHEGAKLIDLDDPASLVALGTRPSRVITRNYSITQPLALRIFGARSTAGLSWWSYYEALWTSVGVWDMRRLEVIGTRQLRVTDALVRDAAAAIGRPVES